MKFIVWFVVVISAVNCNEETTENDPGLKQSRIEGALDEQGSAEYWKNLAQNTLKGKLKATLNKRNAKNIILFIGDGMSISTLTAARILKGQRKGKLGEDEQLAFEKFPYTGLSKTYCVDTTVPDSACTSTAYMCGVKNQFATIGVSGNVTYNDCTESEDPSNQVESIVSWAQKTGKGTGIVTTAKITDASPAGGYAHTANRNWQCDADMGGIDPTICQDIASQLIKNSPGNGLNVILGGGRGKFLPTTNKGERKDGQNLITQWKIDHPNGRYVVNKEELLKTDFSETDHILGLFRTEGLSYNLVADKTKEPSLTEMTESAIKILSKHKNGFFLFVEGAHIDNGHHDTQARLALDETLEFSNAVQKAVHLTDPTKTLIVVTSDHAHTMTISGYPKRGENILGLHSDNSNVDNLPYTIINYANGPKNYLDSTGKQLNLNGKITELFQYPGLVPLDLETHDGSDVTVFANGPYSHLFSGVYEQNTSHAFFEKENANIFRKRGNNFRQ